MSLSIEQLDSLLVCDPQSASVWCPIFFCNHSQSQQVYDYNLFKSCSVFQPFVDMMMTFELAWQITFIWCVLTHHNLWRMQLCLQAWCLYAVHDGSFSLSWIMRCLWMRVMVRAMVLSALVPPSHLTAASTGAWQPCHACLAPQWSRRYPAHLQQNRSDTLDAYKLERWWCRCICCFEQQWLM